MFLNKGGLHIPTHVLLMLVNQYHIPNTRTSNASKSIPHTNSMLVKDLFCSNAGYGVWTHANLHAEDHKSSPYPLSSKPVNFLH